MLETAIALNRFGLGARPTDRLTGNPERWLADQFSRFDPRPAMIADVPSRAVVVGELADYAFEARMAKREKAQMMPASLTMNGIQNPKPPMDPKEQSLRQAIRDDYLQMTSARLSSALATDTPFAERLVHFWANHFAVSVDKLQVIGLAGLLEFEAIRPNIFGRFSDLLLSVEQHPAMLLFLDQIQSIGPNSQVAIRAAQHGGNRRGLNENLAREIMELHTLGVRTGYSQADVTEFARALTGWTVTGLGPGQLGSFSGGSGDGQFAFAPMLHEPGDRTIMNKRYPQSGESQGRQILLDLASNPATARHISTKLARHFAGDDPPPALVERLTNSYRSSSGDLAALYQVLIASPETWAAQPVKFKTPWEWSVSSLRALGETSPDPKMTVGMLKQLGQPIWQPGSPAGWDDIAASWAAPEAMMRRLEIAQRFANHAGSSIDPRDLAQKVLPGGLSDRTKVAIARAESPQEGLALLLVSPEFVRR